MRVRRVRQIGAAVITMGLISGLSFQPQPVPEMPGGSGISAVAHAASRSSDLHIDLKESVGEEWFQDIGDRELELLLIKDVHINDLPQLNVPQLLRDNPDRFISMAKKTTSDGEATFKGVEPGVYLLNVADNKGTKDSRVSYAPFVIAVSGDGKAHNIELKAQVLNTEIQPRTSCSVAGGRFAVAAGGRIVYEISGSAPNVSADGEIKRYEVTTTVSVGHKAESLAVDSVRIVGAGKQLELSADQYRVENTGTTVKLAFKDSALQQLADLRRLDPSTVVKASIAVRAEADAVGELSATTTILTDGMDAERRPVEVSDAASLPVVAYSECMKGTDSTTPAVPSGGQSLPSSAPGSSSDAGSGEPEANGFPPLPTEDGHQGPLSAAEGDPDSSQKDGKHGKILGSLASTGASVIGIVALGVVLILGGLIVLARRRKDDEDSNQHVGPEGGNS